jgi:hypothetical protein
VSCLRTTAGTGAGGAGGENTHRYIMAGWTRNIVLGGGGLRGNDVPPLSFLLGFSGKKIPSFFRFRSLSAIPFSLLPSFLPSFSLCFLFSFLAPSLLPPFFFSLFSLFLLSLLSGLLYICDFFLAIFWLFFKENKGISYRLPPLNGLTGDPVASKNAINYNFRQNYASGYCRPGIPECKDLRTIKKFCCK